jgi:hypothetical protein
MVPFPVVLIIWLWVAVVAVVDGWRTWKGRAHD